ncbi:hypothetical protein F4678DRAFT_141430 [Xylaria arbuscula]|nr:hypothetical protein F4678DRAFT_141430 [Xylaria arbuscula]
MMYTKKALLSAAVLTSTAVAQTSSTSSSSSASSTDNALACTRSYASLLAGAPTPSSDLAAAITSYASSAGQSATANGAGNQDPQAVLTQACSFSSQLPSSLQSQFDAYATSLLSYVSASSSYIDAVITDCIATGDQGASYTSFVNSLATHSGPLCQATGGAGGNGTSSSTGGSSSTGSGTGATQTSSGTGTGGSGGGSTTTTGGVGGAGGGSTTTTGGGNGGSTSSPSTGAAAAPTALYGGAAAAAGILGAAILL